MDLIELIVIFAGIICVSIISYGLFLIKPYPEPIITEGKIVEKYTLDEVKCFTAAFPSGSTSMPVTVQTLLIAILTEKECKTKIRVEKEKYDSLEIDDPVEITEYSRIKKMVEKKRNLHSRNEGINN